MKSVRAILLILVVFICCPYVVSAQLQRPDTNFKIFQFPADKIPTVDGKSDDWMIVPDGYAIGTDQLIDDSGKHKKPDPKTLDVKVRVGYVKGINRLYFLYEAYDDYWDFSRTDLHNDTFEVVVDADLSGGPLIDEQHPNKEIDRWDAFFNFHGIHAQNYHTFTPAEGKDWTMLWGPQQWLKELPYSNAAYNYNFKPGESGRLTFEFWITPFDYADPENSSRSVESKLTENKTIGMSWAIIDYDDAAAKGNNGFWNLSRKHTMYGNASELVNFKLMPLEPRFKKAIEAEWSSEVTDMNRRLVAFKDLSIGKITAWKWDFGDGAASTEQHPVHQYEKAGKYVVTLYIEGPEGKSRRAKVWQIAVR
ncbi:MAG: PKD domain-containing protein [Acidobacteriota bacterium]|nr:PKD domain-containing protein [Acidobacteriota bacterium]